MKESVCFISFGTFEELADALEGRFDITDEEFDD